WSLGRRHVLQDRLEGIEYSDGEAETVEVRRRIGDLPDPVGIDIAEADRPERGIRRRGVVRVYSADARERHVVQDRVGAEQTEVAAELERAETVIAERHEDLAHVESGRSQRRVQPLRPLLKVRAAVVRGDAGEEAEREADVVAVLRRRRADR